MEWGDADHLWAFAYELYLQTLCPDCGGSVLVCRNDDNAANYEADTYTCFASAAVAERRKFDKDFGAGPGERPYPFVSDEEFLVGSGLGVYVPD